MVGGKQKRAIFRFLQSHIQFLDVSIKIFMFALYLYFYFNIFIPSNILTSDCRATSLMKLRAITSSFPRKMLRSKLILIVISLLLVFFLRYSLKPQILFFSRTAKIISYATNTVKLHRSALLPNFEEKFSRLALNFEIISVVLFGASWSETRLC